MGRAQSAIATTPQQRLRPVAATPVRSLARWRGESSQLPQAEVVLVASLAQNGAGFSLLLHNNSLLQTVFVHAALGGDGPRWQPLNGADCHALWARRQLESVLAGGNDDGGIKCDRTTTVLVHRLGSGWRQQRRSGPVSSATESKFVYFSCIIGLFSYWYYFVIFGLSFLYFQYSAFFKLVSYSAFFHIYFS
jgi:hypothetical protein